MLCSMPVYAPRGPAHSALKGANYLNKVGRHTPCTAARRFVCTAILRARLHIQAKWFGKGSFLGEGWLMKKSSKRRANAYFRGQYPTKLKAYEEFERPNRRSDILEYGFVFVMITGALSLGAYKLAIEPATIAASEAAEAAISASCMQQVAGIAPAAGRQTLKTNVRTISHENGYDAVRRQDGTLNTASAFKASGASSAGQPSSANEPETGPAGDRRSSRADTYAVPPECF